MKFMNKKRFASSVLAGTLALSLAAPALAANNTTTNIAGSYADIPIAVVVPTTGTAQINPYGLPVSITKSNDSTVDLTGQKITTRPLSVKNQGAIALELGVSSFIVVPKGDVSVAAAADNNKAIKVDLEVAGLDDAALAIASDNEKLDDLLIDRFAAVATWAGAQKLAAPTAAKGDTAADITAAKTTNPMATLGAATVKGDLTTYGKDSIALFRLTGDLAQEPATDPWKETDGFESTIGFKFTPAAPTAGDATLTLDNTTLSAGGSLTATFAAGTSGRSVVAWSWAKAGGADITVTSAANDNKATVVEGSVSTGDTSTITVTATLDNGATLTASCVYTK